MSKSIALLAVVAAVAVMACNRSTVYNTPNGPSAFATPTPTPTPVIVTPIEFRVVGTPASARVRYFAPADGDIQVVTALPYTASVTTTADAVFLSLDATPIASSTLNSFPFFSIQIVVNHVVFREASSTDFAFTTLSVSGTWRR